MDHQASALGYLIPLSLIAGFILFPALLWLGKDRNTKKSSEKKESKGH